MAGPLRIDPGDIVELKKGHPCGANRWAVVRTGLDIKLQCQGCGRYVTLPRPRIERRIKRLLRQGEEDRSTVPNA